MKKQIAAIAVITMSWGAFPSGMASNTDGLSLPEFVRPERYSSFQEGDKAIRTTGQSSLRETGAAFYTGKPYDMDSDTYIYRFRNYDPSVVRWTSLDPSGFPDGANNNIYVGNPTSYFDPNGLEQNQIYINPSITLNNFTAAFTQAIAGLTAPGGMSTSIWNGLLGLITSTVNSWIPGIPVGTFQAGVTATGDFDNPSSTWSNPGITFSPGNSASIGLNGTVAGTVQVNGTIGYSVSYVQSGSPTFSSVNTKNTTVDGMFVPQISMTISGALTVVAGGSFSSTGGVNGTAQNYSVPLQAE